MMEILISQIPLLSVIFALLSMVVMVAVLGMCVCFKSNKPASTSEDIEMPRVNGSISAVPRSRTHKKSSSEVVSPTDVNVREDKPPSNGSVPVDSNGRPMSHEDRALPAIPGTNSDVVTATDDEDEIDGGHYDIISRTQQRKNSNPTGRSGKMSKNSEQVASAKEPGADRIIRNHQYAKVTNPEGDIDSDSTTYAGGAMADPTYAAVSEKSSDLDPTYAGVKDDDLTDSSYAGVQENQSVDASTAGRKTGTNPYATVVNIGEAEYAQISEKKKSSKKKSKSGKGKKKDGGGKATARPSETMESIAPPAPPVPVKSLDPLEVGASLQHAAGSPSLPPRNSGASPFEGTNLQDIPYADENISAGNSPQHHASPALSQTGAVGATASVNSSITSQQSAEPGGASGGKREPPYSKVTARESLDELRRRQGFETTAVTLTPENDPSAFNYEPMDYDQINYEMIKTPGVRPAAATPAGKRGVSTGDRASLQSDLYAEIGSTAEGMQSQRSATNDRVSELPRQGGAHAPTPPPVETLRNLSSNPVKYDHDLSLGGYHQVKDIKRPSSVCSSGSSNYNTVQDVANYQQQQNIAEYAVVDKSKKKRQTVHNINTDGYNNNSSGDDVWRKPQNHEHLYAKVDKAGKSGKTGSGGSEQTGGKKQNSKSDAVYDNQSFLSYQAKGARPKEFAASGNGGGQNRKSSGHRRSRSKGTGSDFTVELLQRGRESVVGSQNSHSLPRHNNNLSHLVNSDRMNSNSSPIIVNGPATASGDGLIDLEPSGEKVAPGYQTIGGLSSSLPPGDVIDDPDYDTVEEQKIVYTSDHDPNYESLPGSATGMVLSRTAAAQNHDTSSVPSQASQQQLPVATAQHINMNPDGSTEISLVQVNPAQQNSIVVGSGNNNSAAAGRNWVRREHIYQEIQDAKNENIYTPDPTHHPRQHHQHSRVAAVVQPSGESASGSRNQQQFVTNL